MNSRSNHDPFKTNADLFKKKLRKDSDIEETKNEIRFIFNKTIADNNWQMKKNIYELLKKIDTKE